MATSTSTQATTSSTSSTNSSNPKTLTPNAGYQLAAIPFNLPDQVSPSEWTTIRKLASHLSTNLVQISVLDVIGTDEKLLDMKTILDLCGSYYRHVRSYYWCNSQEALVDFVPKDNFTLPSILQFTGHKTIKGHRVIVNYDRAIYRIPLQMIGDYASLLAIGKTANNSMVKEFLYPNPSWEPPVTMIPHLMYKAGGYDVAVSTNCYRFTYIDPQGANAPPNIIS